MGNEAKTQMIDLIITNVNISWVHYDSKQILEFVLLLLLLSFLKSAKQEIIF